MTHEELKDKIYWHWRKDTRGDGLQPMVDYRRVLLAVVELHKPVADGCGDVDCCGPQMFICSDCPTYNYPCPTIQAIEKELL